ncbi:hypothetical protein FD15_GL001023 [Liquorilactobacillus sucicola DSM 21376 = JCM 15457]|uniref:BS ykrK family protein n=1 Tax=Liquorilactobacillus sucicola DSM 21376 = JCM 15457 TaxID=1423806 RepID=A0A0R2DQR5_9LACO|nr:DUF1836 domain-containing protein [Liquorilactobacillus sucicola]KRN06402.1 hypothetical protein FD15_GL001023 [Liquorilactobacillus sucicola DSM 21376 = JCM 15457]
MNDGQFKKWLEEFSQIRLPLWDEFPDLELYMDQLVSLGNRYLSPLLESEITPSMINSYVKKGLMQRPTKKKYTTSNLAELVVISLLKSIYPLETIRDGITQSLKNNTIEESYSYFANLFNSTLQKINLEDATLNFNYKDELILLTEQFSVHSVIYKIIGQKLIDLQHAQQADV